MVDRRTRSADDELVPTISQLIAAQMDATGRSFRDLWRASGERVKHQTFQELRSGTPKSWPKSVETIRGMAEALDVSETAIVLAFARSLGIEVSAEPMLAQQLPAASSQLSPAERNAIVALIRAITSERESHAQEQEPRTQEGGPEQRSTGGSSDGPGAAMKPAGTYTSDTDGDDNVLPFSPDQAPTLEELEGLPYFAMTRGPHDPGDDVTDHDYIP
ncbi:hypothetical protein [Rhodococcus jostii]|uniref:hypothetical protein n=1 Tax=Rhodococcus jostii TaxID=132919 RepID=UPI003645CB08